MAMTRPLAKTVTILVTLMLLWSPVVPALGPGPGDPGTRASTEGGSLTEAEDDLIKLYSTVTGPDDTPGFGSSLTNLLDVDGDGVHDMVVGTGWTYGIEWGQGRIPPVSYGFGTFFMPGQEDREYDADDWDVVGNHSDQWSYHAQRWLGDVNDDGHADMVNSVNYYIEGGNGNDEIWPPPFDNNLIEVRYGAEDGLPDEPDLLIKLRPEGIPNETYVSFSIGGVGDVNGDGYDDLFVFRHRITVWVEGPGNGERPPPGDPDDPSDPPEPYPKPVPEYIEPEFQLYFGSEDGLPEAHSWNGTPELETEWWSIQGVHHADLNGDGHSDVILTSGQAPHVSIYHGTDDGIPPEPDRTISFGSDFTYGWRLTAPLDANGDDYEDFVIDYGQPEGLFDYVQWVYVFEGSEGGVPVKPSHTHKLVSEENARVVMTDVNGDGLDDVFLHASLDNDRDDGTVDVKLQVHFNTGEGFGRDPSWQSKVQGVNGGMYAAMSDGGDFDGDGLGDVAIGMPGYYWKPRGDYMEGPGQVIIVHGAGIMDLLKPLRLLGGPVLYAGYQAYDFLVNINPTGLVQVPYAATLTLDPNGVAAVLSWDSSIDGINPFSYDPADPLKLESDADDAVLDQANNTVWLHFRVMVDWAWPHEDLCDVKVTLHGLTNASAPYVAKDLFRVENDLDFSGDLKASGEFQGDLEEGDWVRAGETITVSGPVVVYEGTEDLYPPSGVCKVVLMDNDGDHAIADLVSGVGVSLALAADAVTDAEENLTLSLQDLPGEASVVSNPRFQVRVDGDLPTFTKAVPGPDDWHSSTEVQISITSDDGATSGVAAETLEYRFSRAGEAAWSDWSRAGLATTVDGPTVDGMVTLELPDGDNAIAWRVRDLVGNDFAVSEPLRIRVDTMNVTFSGAYPDADAWLRVLEVECGITIRDTEGAGIDVSSIQFRYSHHNLSGYGDWQDWEEGSQGDAQQVTVGATIVMGESPYNYVQWRAMDIAGNGFTTSRHHRVRVDATPVVFDDLAPVDEPQGASLVEVFANVSDGPLGSGVDLATLDFRYATGGGDWSGWQTVGIPSGTAEGIRFSVKVELEDGTDNRVQFRGLDVAGNGPSTSDVLTVVVDTTGPEFGAVSPGPDEKQPAPEVTVTVTLSDAVAGLDANSVEYMYTTEGGGGEWQKVPAEPQVDGTYLVQVSITLERGQGNTVAFRASDVMGNRAETAEATIWVNRLPTANIRSPTSGVEYREDEPVLMSANGSSDPDGDELNFTWYVDGAAAPLGHGKELIRLLEPGTYNITLVVKDDAGAEDTVQVRVTVERVVPPKGTDGNNGWLLILVLIVVITAAGAGYYVYRRRRAPGA